MKTIAILLMLVSALLVSCGENERLISDAKARVKRAGKQDVYQRSDEQQRRALLKVYVHGLEFADIASVGGIDEPATPKK